MADKALIKQIGEQKLKAFSFGNMGKRALSKKEVEEMKKKEQEQAAAQAFEEFVATFQESPSKSGNKVWIKAGTYDAGKRQEDTRDKGKLYKPQSRLSELSDKMTTAEKAQEYARILSDRGKPDRLGRRRKEGEKKKSNLELFKEELKLIQEEREERHKYKGIVKAIVEEVTPPPVKAPSDFQMFEEAKMGSFDNGDPTTTNLYLGNLNPKITEQQLMEVFGRYGPLASIKIMWPRSDEEKARGRNCGFVAFMNRKDGERALKGLNGKDVMQYEMKLGWGKSVPIPPRPIYIPQSMLELTLPPPPSGLPFNAQPHKKDKHKVAALRSRDFFIENAEMGEQLDKILCQAVVKVVIPTERNLLMLIHRMIEFVIREGPMFEAMVMNREISNPMFRFLFENQSPAHVYYRWKLYSLLQGDVTNKWRVTDFRMFKGGSIWRPPPMNPYTQGMPDDLIETDDREPRKGSLSNSQRDRLEDLLRNLTPERMKVAEAMVFCIEHAEAAEEICDCLAEALSILQTPIPKKVARLYLISDILHNCGVKITNATSFRKGLESRLLNIFQDIHLTYTSLESRLKAEGFKVRIMHMFHAWEEWAVYPRDFLIQLQNTFLGITATAIEQDEIKPESHQDDDVKQNSEADEDEGEPHSEGGEDLDIPLDGAALLKGALKHKEEIEAELEERENSPDSVPASAQVLPAGFIPSRWETVDPEQIEAQAMTTSKWDQLEQQQHPNDSGDDEGDSSQGATNLEASDERRSRLRMIELKAIQYQDELESGQRTLKSGWTVQQQVEHYRRKLLRKAEKGEKNREREDRERDRDFENNQDIISEKSDRKRREREKERRRSETPEDLYQHRESNSRSKGKRSRSSSGSPPSKRQHRSRSRSPRKSSRRSRSPGMRKYSLSRVDSVSPPSRSKRRSSPSSPRIKQRSPPSVRSKRRGSSSPSPPPRKHKHKHKY